MGLPSSAASIAATVGESAQWRKATDPAETEGAREFLYCEASGAVALAGALQAKKGGLVDPAACIVCLVTGSGFKDDAALDRAVSDQPSRMLELNEFLKMSQR